MPTACVLIIGNEILSGRTQDINLNYIAKRLVDLGIDLMEARVVVDDESAIVRAVNECRAAYNYVFTTGGIGPTHDDITAASVAKAFGVKNVLNPRAVALLQSAYKDPSALNEARLRMAHTPEGASLIDNPVSKAPGFQIGNVFVMAGVPKIMQAMFDGLVDRLVGGPPIRSRTLSAYLAEGDLAKPLAQLQGRYPDVAMGSYPFYRMRRFGASIVLRGRDQARIDAAAAELAAAMRALGGEPIEDEPVADE
ncbi:MAG: competence/damage-inducible protein A [Alphaproteobacteria bacterium]|nr:competence/damage-inducible protein A [Alphaproteobacteria bacterium]